MTEAILTNARLVLPDRIVKGAVHLRDRLIAAVDQGRTSHPPALDCDVIWPHRG